MIRNKNLNDYLHFGYVPEFGDSSRIDHILCPPRHLESLENISEEELINIGMGILNEVFDDLVKSNRSSKNVVPLSGGLDSRLILAALVDRVNSKNIQAVTFGSPGTFDFDLPDNIVKKTAVAYKKVNCVNINYSLPEIIKATQNGGRWTSTPDNYINRLSIDDENDTNHWSGFMGGEIAGEYSTLGTVEGDNDVLFCDYQKRSKNLHLAQRDYNPVYSLKKIKDVPYNLTYFEMLFLTNRSAGGAIPIMYPQDRVIISPFLHPLWVNFIIRVPFTYRRHAYLFKKIIFRMYPELMSLGCKNNNGLGLGNENRLLNLMNRLKLKYRYELSQYMNNVNYPPLGANYLYYKAAINSIPSLKESLKEACNSLEDRNIIPWLSPVKILENHLAGKFDYSTPLLILLGLEVNMRVEENLKDTNLNR